MTSCLCVVTHFLLFRLFPVHPSLILEASDGGCVGREQRSTVHLLNQEAETVASEDDGFQLMFTGGDCHRDDPYKCLIVYSRHKSRFQGVNERIRITA